MLIVWSDVWQPCLKVIAKMASRALYILDRFHILARLNKATDEVQAVEAKQLATQGYEPVLKHSRWCFLTRVESLTARQGARLQDLMCCSLKTVRAYLLEESFRRLWEYKSYHRAASRRPAEAGHVQLGGADQEGGPQHPGSPGADPELVSREEKVFRRDCRRAELQDQTDYQKGLRPRDPRSRGNRPLSTS